MNVSALRVPRVRRAVVIATLLLTSLTPVTPLQLRPVRAEEPLPASPPAAVWRVQAISWRDGWSDESESATLDRFSDIQFPTPEHGFASLTGSPGEPRLLEGTMVQETTPEGRAIPRRVWTAVHRGTSVDNVTFFDERIGVGTLNGGTPAAGSVVRSTDRGRTWLPAVHPAVAPINDLAFTGQDSTGVAAVGNLGTILRSSDTGASWTSAPVQAPAPTKDLNAVAFVPGADGLPAVGVAVGAIGPDSKPTILFWDSSSGVWKNALTAPALANVKGLKDVALVKDDTNTLAVAVGDRGTILYSSDGGRNWSRSTIAPGGVSTPTTSVTTPTTSVTIPATSVTIPPTVTGGGGLDLTGVALADTTPGVGGGLTGYIVGNSLTLFEMQDQSAQLWVSALIDVRAAAFLVDVPSGKAEDKPNLAAVAVVDPKKGTAVAVGSRFMLERTPVTDTEQFTDDQWWQCIPEDPTYGPQPVPNDAATDDLVEGLDPSRACDRRGESYLSESPNTTPTPAVPCELAEDASAFPCLAAWGPKDTTSKPAGSGNDAVFFDADVAGEGRRVVVVGEETISLFDPDRREQRGVSGFGDGKVPGVQGRKDASEFDEPSVFGPASGVVNLNDAPRPNGLAAGAIWPPLELFNARRLRTYDDQGNRVYLGTSNEAAETGSRLGTPRIVAVSLTGEFAPAVTEIPPIVDPDAPGRTNVTLTHLGFDATHGMLYALTETNYHRDQVVSFPAMADSTQVMLHAFTAEAGSLTRAWSLPLSDRCRSTFAADLAYFGVSPGGDALAFACAGFANPHFGSPTFESNRVITVRLALKGRKPGDLNPANPVDVSVSSEPIAGKVLQEGHDVTFGLDARSVLVWNQPGAGANLWDFDIGGWIGTVPATNLQPASGFGFGMNAKHPWRGRLYFISSNLLVVDTLNVPAQVPAGVTGTVGIEPGVVRLAIPPLGEGDRPQVVLFGAGVFRFFEDRVAPILERVRPDPDIATHPDVPEAQATDVKRIGHARGYGTRVWWTGLGSASAMGCQYVLGSHEDPTAKCGSPTLSYDWLTDRDSETGAGLVPFGPHANAVPGPPGAGRRELRLGAVQGADLENDLAQAKATGFFYDGGPADDSPGVTGEDLGRRRGRDLHQFADGEIDAAANESQSRLCPTTTTSSTTTTTTTSSSSPTTTTTTTPQQRCQAEHENLRQHQEFDGTKPGDFNDFGDFEARFDEFVDRGMREVDGERRVQGQCDDPKTKDRAEDCLQEFDEGDPRCGRDDPATEDLDESSCFVDEDGKPTDDERGSVEKRVGLTYASNCLRPGDESDDFQALGSHAVCEPAEFGHTGAGAELGTLALVSKEASGATLDFSVGATGSDTQIFRDADEGMVVETTAWATDVELGFPGMGSLLRIGEVRSTARTWAKGIDGSAGSWLDVAYQDVVITGPSGERFACGRADPNAGPPSLDPAKPPTPGDQDTPGDEDINHDGKRDEQDLIYVAGATPDPSYQRPGENPVPVACDPHQVADVISQVFAGKVQVTTSARDTDQKVTGSPGGAQAMVRRDPVAVMSDQVINQIERQFELPALQLTIFNDGLRANRMQIDLAGVYAESHYEIGERQDDDAPEPGAIEIELTDPTDALLEGGEFTIYEDGDGDGSLGDGDAALDECITDSSGMCGFDGLKAGDYLVHQRSAPAGYLPQGEAVGVGVSEGATETVEFVNGPDGAAVEVVLVDPAGHPLSGGQFAVVAKTRPGAAVAPTDALTGACTTGGEGTCGFSRVPLASYVLHQGKAPSGFKAAGDIAFTLSRPGQVARIKVVNGKGVAGARAEIIELIDAVPASHRGGGDPPWWALVPKGLAGIVLRGWRQALLFALTALLFGTPAYLAHRRRELALAKGRPR